MSFDKLCSQKCRWSVVVPILGLGLCALVVSMRQEPWRYSAWADDPHLLSASSDESVNQGDLRRLSARSDVVMLNLTPKASLDDLGGLSENAVIKVLQVQQLSELTSIKPLLSMTSLKDLYLWGCPYVYDIGILGDSKSLGVLSVRDNIRIVSLLGLERSSSLDEVSFEFCSHLRDISALAEIKSLRRLSVSQCPLVSNPINDKAFSHIPVIEFELGASIERRIDGHIEVLNRAPP